MRDDRLRRSVGERPRLVRAGAFALCASVVLVAFGAGCKGCEERTTEEPKAADAAPKNNVVVDELLGLRDAEAPTDAATADAAPPSDAAAPAPIGLEGSRCRLAWGPARLPYRGPGAIRTAPGHLDITFHDRGQLRVHRVDYVKPGPKPVKAPNTPGEVSMSFPACAPAFGVHGREANSVYCTGSEGGVMWTRVGTPGQKQVAKARPSEALAAASFGSEHSVVAFLERRMVAGESTLEAHAVLDDGEPMRISDDGAGATFVSLTALSDRQVLAVMIDARAALSPVHARLLELEQGKLVLRPDTIVHVGASERGGSAAVAHFADGKLVLLLPMPTDVTHYGLLGIPLPMPLQMDLQGELFPYPRGVEFPRVVTAAVGPKVYAALTRTRDASRDSAAVLELTEVQQNGALMPLGIVAEDVPMLDLDFAADEFGSLWLLYGDGKGSLLERRVCP